ncbi:hypothetical protein ACFL0H_14005, partial [Thermodesulfobacteriota bacterium]
QSIMKSISFAWAFILARAELDQVNRRQLETLKSPELFADYQAGLKAFEKTVKNKQAVKKARSIKLSNFETQLQEAFYSPAEKRKTLEDIIKDNPYEMDALVGLIFYSSTREDWNQALEYVRVFLRKGGWHSSDRLWLGLLEPEILHLLGRHKEVRACLEEYHIRTADPWFRAICEHLMGKRSEESLKIRAEKNPEDLIILHTVLGFWAEGAGDKDKAIIHYKGSMESFMDNWIEFEFARERIRAVRQGSVYPIVAKVEDAADPRRRR